MHSPPSPPAAGDLLPRPSFLEANLHRGKGASVKQHFLSTYARSFAAVIRGQFLSKASDDRSRQALRTLAGCRYVQVRCPLLSFCPA